MEKNLRSIIRREVRLLSEATSSGFSIQQARKVAQEEKLWNVMSRLTMYIMVHLNDKDPEGMIVADKATIAQWARELVDATFNDVVDDYIAKRHEKYSDSIDDEQYVGAGEPRRPRSWRF
jgi:hypothetical protein